MKFALDTKRKIDENGFLHVGLSNISKECVSPYYGYEIPNYKALELSANKVYYAYRSAYELNLAVDTFNGLPLLRGHYIEHAQKPQKEHRVGSLGTDCCFSEPYLQNSIIVTDAEAIRKIESGERVELSAAYAYEPILESGIFNGQKYDFLMTNIRGNHVALVEEGRVGADVIVADSNTINKKELNQMDSSEKDAVVELEKINDENEKSLEDLFYELSNLVNDFKSLLANYENQSNCINSELNSNNKSDDLTKAFDNNSNKIRTKDIEKTEKVIREELAIQYKEMQHAITKCLPFTGTMDMFAFDSAEDIYLHACNILNVTATKESAEDVIQALIKNQNIQQSWQNKRVFRSRFD